LKGKPGARQASRCSNGPAIWVRVPAYNNFGRPIHLTQMDERRIVGRRRGDRDHAAHAHQLHERAHLIDIWTRQTLKQARRIAIADGTDKV
jgi:hypothetical protein